MKTGVLISRDTALVAITEKLLEGICRIISFSNIGSGLDYIYSLIPDLLIIDLTVNDAGAVNILNTLKNDPIFTHLPVLAVIDDRHTAATLGYGLCRGLCLAVADGSRPVGPRPALHPQGRARGGGKPPYQAAGQYLDQQDDSAAHRQGRRICRRLCRPGQLQALQ